LLSDVNGHIGDRKPVTATHRVASIQDHDLADGKTQINFSIRITPLSPDLQTLIQDNLRALFLPHRPGATIPISQIRAAISNSGVTDYSIDDLYIGPYWTPVGDVALTGFQYPWLGSISFTELI
jgi:uncharacterized phage protein gp47/JayE